MLDDELIKKSKKIDEEIFFWRLPEFIKYVHANSIDRARARTWREEARTRTKETRARTRTRRIEMDKKAFFSVFFADQPTSTVHDF